MSDPAGAVAEPSLAEYIRSENAKEQSEAPNDASALVPAEVAAVTPSETPAADPEPELEVVAPPVEAERNADGTFKAGKPKNEWQRNRELTARLRDTERQLEAARTSPTAAPVQPAQTPAQPHGVPWADPDDPEPSVDRYLDRPDPYAALAVEAAKWAIRDDRRAQYFQQAQQQIATVQREATARIDAFAAAHPDYHDRIHAIEDIQFPQLVLNTLAEDDDGPAVAYHLAQHPDEARRIAALRPVDGVKEIGKLLSRLTAAPSGPAVPAVSTSRAKALIKPVSASPVVPDSGPPDPDKTSLSDWIRIGNAADRRRRDALHGA